MSLSFLRNLIRLYGDPVQAFVPGYLENSLGSLARERERLLIQLAGDTSSSDLGKFPQANSNSKTPVLQARPIATKQPAQANKDDMEQLRKQLASMQAKLDGLSTGKA